MLISMKKLIDTIFLDIFLEISHRILFWHTFFFFFDQIFFGFFLFSFILLFVRREFTFVFLHSSIAVVSSWRTVATTSLFPTHFFRFTFSTSFLRLSVTFRTVLFLRSKEKIKFGNSFPFSYISWISRKVTGDLGRHFDTVNIFGYNPKNTRY